MKLNKKLTEGMLRRRLLWSIQLSEDYLCKNLVGKEEGGHSLKGGVLLRAYGTSLMLVTLHQASCMITCGYAPIRGSMH